MKKSFLLAAVFLLLVSGMSGADFRVVGNRLQFLLDDRRLLTTPEEGLWSIATDWTDDWMSGWVHAHPQSMVSPQNQHIDVYGVLFAPEIYKMGIYLQDERLEMLAPVMYRSCFQLTAPQGSQGEQLQQTNYAQHGDMSNVHMLRGGYSESWTVFWITAHFLNAVARFVEMNIIP
ncbi:MAG: hypothetical protein LBL04_06920 [Bacteroidales bacterium]|nr:hypothetical protein [Bacteroidales bacterium]